jgi:hypothetical protein
MDFNGYEIFVTNQTLPHLEGTWTSVDVTSTSGTFSFKRETNKSRVFDISGYISKTTWAATRSEAEGLNNSLNSTPSGVFTDGYGTQYTCLVDSWSIEPLAALNKYTFTMTLRILS